MRDAFCKLFEENRARRFKIKAKLGYFMLEIELNEKIFIVSYKFLPSLENGQRNGTETFEQMYISMDIENTLRYIINRYF